MACDHRDVCAIQRMALNDVSDDMQIYLKKWIVNLGILNKPGVPREAVITASTERAKDIEAMLESDCAKQMTSFVSIDVLQTVLTLFCEREECDLSDSMISVLEMLVPLRCSTGELYNIFYAIMTKFIPRNTNFGADCYHLMHLILQYHDPYLSSHLESHKITPHDYAFSPFSTFFASVLSKSCLYPVWDKIFEKGDPYLIFVMVLVFLINRSKDLLALKDKCEMLQILKTSMTNLTAEDLVDFVDLSVHFLSQTPTSIKQDFQRVLFGPKKAGEVRADIAKLLTLPVDVRDVIRMGLDENFNTNTMGVEPIFFTIDARSHDEYVAGHLGGSYNLDSSLFVDAPDQYKMALTSLDSYRNVTHPDEHILFMGSGHDNDLYLNMVIANFLQQGRKYVAFVNGGYKALHKQLENSLERLDGHCEMLCRECTSVKSNINSPTRRTSWKFGVGDFFGVMRANAPNLSQKVKQLPKIVTIGSYAAELPHVESSQRHGKRYRNERSVFTLSDSDSETEDCSVVTKSRPSESKKLDDVLQQDDVLEHFEGIEILFEEGIRRTVGCYLVLTRTHILIFHGTNETDEVVLCSRHAYSSVLRVSSKKKIPEMLTFKFGYCANHEYKETATHRFILSRAGDCAKAVKLNIISLCPSVLD